jgi:hypothetical protein
MISLRRGRSAHGDSGVAAVEFAIVVPVLLLLVVGMLEFSFVMRDYLSVASSVRVGARMASTSEGIKQGTCPGLPVICSPSNTPALAQYAADAIQQAGIAMPQDLIQYIAVYKANANGYPGTATSMPADSAGCVALGNCVVYRWSKSLDRFVYDGGTWTSASINACLPTPDSVGVFMRANHPYLTKMFGSTMSITDRAVMRLEPLPANTCAPGTRL